MFLYRYLLFPRFIRRVSRTLDYHCEWLTGPVIVFTSIGWGLGLHQTVSKPTVCKETRKFWATQSYRWDLQSVVQHPWRRFETWKLRWVFLHFFLCLTAWNPKDLFIDGWLSIGLGSRTSSRYCWSSNLLNCWREVKLPVLAVKEKEHNLVSRTGLCPHRSSIALNDARMYYLEIKATANDSVIRDQRGEKTKTATQQVKQAGCRSLRDSRSANISASFLWSLLILLSSVPPFFISNVRSCHRYLDSNDCSAPILLLI